MVSASENTGSIKACAYRSIAGVRGERHRETDGVSRGTPKVEYSITEFGIHFKAVLEQMVILGQQYINTKQVPNE